MRRAICAGVGVVIAAAAGAAGPVFHNLYDFNAEYALDLLSNAWDPEDRARHRAASTAIHLSGGSLNIRHLQVREDVKVRLPVGERVSARFRRERRLGLQAGEERDLLEIEGRVAGPWHAGIFGSPAFHKARASFGVAGAWRHREDRSVRLSVLWPDFDTNYAYKHTSVTEDHRVAYRAFPRDVRGEVVWRAERTGFALDGLWSRPWEREREDFAPSSARHVETGAQRRLAMDLSHRADRWIWSAEGECVWNEAAIAHVPTRPTEDRAVREKSFRAIVSLEREAGSSSLRGTAAPAFFSGRQSFPGSPASDDSYMLRDWIFGVSHLPRWGTHWSAEASYYLDLQSGERRQGNVQTQRPRTQNRGTVALRWRGEGGGGFRLAANIELDKNESETFFSFDGGVIQFQTVFR